MPTSDPNILLQIFFIGLMTLNDSKPIMVSFGTSQGPIVPRQPKSLAAQERIIGFNKNPAPVSEQIVDTPNPNHYQPLVPHQYRTKLYALKPPANLILGTPLDQKFTPALQKYALSKIYSRSIGVDYTGPHIFDVQDYEIEQAKTQLKPSVRYTRPVLTPQQVPKSTGYQYFNGKYVPQIGVVYSSGVRYYIPQIVAYSRQPIRNPVDENSVYGTEDERFHH